MDTSKADWRTRIIESFHVVLVLVGALLFVLAVTGGVRYKDLHLSIDGPIRQTTCAGAGVVLIAVGVGLGVWRSIKHPTRTIRPQEFGITIVSPQKGDVVHTVDVRGTLKSNIPSGYTLRVIRVYPDNRIYPLREATIDPDGHTWEARSCDIGGNPGDDRFLAACLSGPGAEALFAYLEDAVHVHNATLNALAQATSARGQYLPAIRQKPPDLVECFRVPLKRRPRST